ncbi:MAG: hypothetical protein JO244_07355 [Solirubrobacterales bacterium]|nr:hypothetical protein [Solirubrobacterales bacterium]
MLNPKPNLLNDPVLIRLATGDDADSLELLAELNTSSPPLGPVLMAESGGRPVAALSLVGGDALADPFLPTAQLVALLRLRAQQVRPPAHLHGRDVLVRLPTAAGRAIRHAGDRLRRLLPRPVAVQRLPKA